MRGGRDLAVGDGCIWLLGTGWTGDGGRGTSAEGRALARLLRILVVTSGSGGLKPRGDGFGGDFVAEAHSDGSGGEGDVAVAGVPSGEGGFVVADELSA